MRAFQLFLIAMMPLLCNSQEARDTLAEGEIQEDLEHLDSILQHRSSYQGLNGYNYQEDFESYLKEVENKRLTPSDLALFLSKVIGKFGDRHSYIKETGKDETFYFPLSFAPYDKKVVVLDYERDKREFVLKDSNFPYLKTINAIPIATLFPQILPRDLRAPEKSRMLHVVRELRDIGKIFESLHIDLPNPLPITLMNEDGDEREINVTLVSKNEKARLWDERFVKKHFFLQAEEPNTPEVVRSFFKVKNDIGYIRLTKMLDYEESPYFFEYLNTFMMHQRQSQALVIDVRDNGGGTRDLIQELAGYLIRPETTYVVNVARQRSNTPLSKEIVERLHARYLYAYDALYESEQRAVDSFMESFEPMYRVSEDRFSAYYYYLLNGLKLSERKYYYDKPVYILANERTFSAASVLVSVFKGLPNITIVGVNTDGSSGNSVRFTLPNSQLRGKISTMLSFQKNGVILDGYGTPPDIVIERDLDQVLFKQDHQLSRLLEIIGAH